MGFRDAAQRNTIAVKVAALGGVTRTADANGLYASGTRSPIYGQLSQPRPLSAAVVAELVAVGLHGTGASNVTVAEILGALDATAITALGTLLPLIRADDYSGLDTWIAAH